MPDSYSPSKQGGGLSWLKRTPGTRAGKEIYDLWKQGQSSQGD